MSGNFTGEFLQPRLELAKAVELIHQPARFYFRERNQRLNPEALNNVQVA